MTLHSSLAPVNTASELKNHHFQIQTRSINIRDVYDLLSLSDECLVDQAYRTLLNRDPDPSVRAFYLGKLREGMGKVSVIAQIALSKDAQLHSVTLPGLDGLIKNYQKKRHWLWGWWYRLRDVEHAINRLENRLHSTGVELISQRQEYTAKTDLPTSIKELQTMPEEGFVAYLYNFFLGRHPDEGGLNHYLQELRSGRKSHLDILLDIAQSEEARQFASHACISRECTQTSTAHPNIPTELAQLSPRARQIYADLKQAIERHQKGGV